MKKKGLGLKFIVEGKFYIRAVLGTLGIPKIAKLSVEIEIELTLVRKSVGVRLGFIRVRQGFFRGLQISAICGRRRLGLDFSR